MMRRFLFILTLLPFTGCVQPPAEQAASPVDPAAQQDQLQPGKIVNLSQDGNWADKPKSERDAPRNMLIVFRLECYQLKLPRGAVSQNEEFWKRMNEQCVNDAIYRQLFLNGMRVGTAPFSEWDYIKNIIQQNPGSARTMATVGAEMKNIELEMKKGIVSQNIFAFDQTSTLVGRTYERCNNLLSISYQKAPRKLGEVRLSVAPTVRSMVKRLMYTALNNELEVEYAKPTSYYLGLIVDIPVDHFLVLSPSSESQNITSLGKAFLVEDAPSEQFETVLVFLARPFRAEEPGAEVGN